VLEPCSDEGPKVEIKGPRASIIGREFRGEEERGDPEGRLKRREKRHLATEVAKNLFRCVVEYDKKKGGRSPREVGHQRKNKKGVVLP